jgi:type IV pilus assembly protein PilM
MPTQITALDIGSFAVRAAELSVNGDLPAFRRFAQVTLPEGAVRDGEVVDVSAVSAAVRRLWREGGFGAKRVVVGVGNRRLVVRQAELPAMDESDLRASLRYEAQDLIPIPLENAVLDFQVLEETVSPEGDPRLRVLLAAAEADMVRTHLAAVENAGLRASAVDVIPFALVRALNLDGAARSFEEDGTAEAIVCIGGGVTNVVVHRGGAPQLVRVLQVGGDDINETIAREYNVDLDDAEDMKRRANASSVFPSMTSAARVVSDRLTALVGEIRGSLDYYMAQPDSVPIGRVLVTGGGARTPGLMERLRTELAGRVELAHPLAGLRVARTGLSESQLVELEPLLTVPIGLALAGARRKGIRRISLLPSEVVAVERRRRQSIAVGAGVAGLAVILLALWAAKGRQVTRERERAVEAERQITQLKAEEAALSDTTALGADLAARQSQVKAVLVDDVAWTRLFQEVATVIPNDVWLTAFTALKGAPGTVNFTAKGFDQTSTARWLLRVGELKSLSGLWVPNSARTGPEGGALVNFTSTASLTEQARSQRVETAAGAAP